MTRSASINRYPDACAFPFVEKRKANEKADMAAKTKPTKVLDAEAKIWCQSSPDIISSLAEDMTVQGAGNNKEGTHSLTDDTVQRIINTTGNEQ